MRRERNGKTRTVDEHEKDIILSQYTERRKLNWCEDKEGLAGLSNTQSSCSHIMWVVGAYCL